MLFGGYLGESEYIPAVVGFVIAIAGWTYILYEIYILYIWFNIKPRPCKPPKVTNNHDGPCQRPAIRNTIMVINIDFVKVRSLKLLDSG